MSSWLYWFPTKKSRPNSSILIPNFTSKRACQTVGCKHRVGPAHMLRPKLIKWDCFLKLPKLACHSLGNDLGVWGTLKLKKQKITKTEAIRPWVKSWSKREPFGHFGVSSREIFSLRGAVRKDRKKHSESVREWKRKRRHFSLLSYTQGR